MRDLEDATISNVVCGCRGHNYVVHPTSHKAVVFCTNCGKVTYLEVNPEKQ